MKDEHSVPIRLAFAFVLIAVLLAYAYFLYSPLRARVMDSYREHISLEKEKDDIAEIMLDPGLISERITDMEGQLLETRPIKGLTPAGVVDDITRSIDRFGLDLQNIVLGVPEAPGSAAVTDAPRLLSMPVTIHMTAPYDGGMYFLGSLEKSETGTYKIGGFSLKRVEPEPEPLLPDAEADEASGAEAGSEDADIAEADEASADANDESEPDAAVAAKIYSIFEWTVIIYLLYYG
jgi:hypothetical protein